MKIVEGRISIAVGITIERAAVILITVSERETGSFQTRIGVHAAKTGIA